MFIRFLPFLPGSSLFIMLGQAFATVLCVLGAVCLWPFSFFQEVYSYKDELRGATRRENRRIRWGDDSEEEGEVLEREMRSPSR